MKEWLSNMEDTKNNSTNSNYDAYTPREMAMRVEEIGVAKANLKIIPTFALSVLAGAFTGPAAHGMGADVLLGTLYRLGGADIGIFPGPGGRIMLSSADAIAVARAQTGKLGSLRPTLPATGGGKSLEDIPGAIADYGKDLVMIVGGALQSGEGDFAARTRDYILALARKNRSDGLTP